MSYYDDMDEKPEAWMWSLILVAVLAGVVLLALLACSDGDDDRDETATASQALGLAVTATVTCCEYSHREVCREVDARLLEKRGYRCAHKITFSECGECLERTPGMREEICGP